MRLHHYSIFHYHTQIDFLQRHIAIRSGASLSRLHGVLAPMKDCMRPYAENPCSYSSANFPATTVSPISVGCTLESEGAFDGGFLLPQTWCYCGEGQTAANYPTITPAAAGSDICDYTTAPATELTLTNAECSLTAASTLWRTAWCGCEGVSNLFPTPATSCDFTVAPTSTISTTHFPRPHAQPDRPLRRH